MQLVAAAMHLGMDILIEFTKTRASGEQLKYTDKLRRTKIRVEKKGEIIIQGVKKTRDITIDCNNEKLKWILET